MRRVGIALPFLAVCLVSATAQAIPTTVTFSGTITRDDTEVVGIGSPFTFEVMFESTEPDLAVATPNFYFASGDLGTLTSELIIPVTGSVLQVQTMGTTSWIGMGTIQTPVGAVDWTMDLTGAGLVPDQILPAFSGSFAGDIQILIALLGGQVDASIESIAIDPPLEPIPEPGTGMLLALGFGGIAFWRHGPSVRPPVR